MAIDSSEVENPPPAPIKPPSPTETGITAADAAKLRATDRSYGGPGIAQLDNAALGVSSDGGNDQLFDAYKKRIDSILGKDSSQGQQPAATNQKDEKTFHTLKDVRTSHSPQDPKKS